MLKMKKIVMMALLVTVSMVFLCGNSMAVNAKININTATVAELAQLEEIDELFAQMIVDYRMKNGPFAKTEDLSNVTGISPKAFELNKDNIVVESEKAAE